MTFEELRMKDRWTRKLLAKELGIDQSTIAKWEREKRFPRWDNLFKLADILKVKPEVIMSSLREQHRLY